MRVTSTSKTPCTCALVRFDMIMCSAIFLRITDMGTTSPGVTPPTGCIGPVWRRHGRSGRRWSCGCWGRIGGLLRSRGLRRSCCSALAVLGDEAFDVFFGDAAAQPGAGHLRQVDVVFLGDLAHQRAGANASLLAGFGYRALILALDAFLLVFRQVSGDRLFA